MMLYRSLVLGLVGALILIEVGRPSPRAVGATDASSAPTIVDVSRAALDTGVDVGPVVGLRLGERVARVDDQPVSDGMVAVSEAIRTAAPGQFLDLDVLRGGAARRVLVLVH